jgi:hypothetical protein
MIASAVLIPAATSALSSVASSLLTPQSAPAPSSAATSNQANVKHDTQANLGQTLLQGAATLFPTALRGGPEEKAKGAGLMVGGAAAEGLGKRFGMSGGLLSKAVGAGLVYGGRAAQEFGKSRYDSADSTTNNTGNYNAYSPSNWGSRPAS